MKWAAVVMGVLAGACAFPKTLPVDGLPAAVSDTCPKLSPWRRVTPKYPRTALDARQDGWVLVEFDLPPHGVPTNPRLFASSPPEVFDEVAVAAITKFRYPTGRDYKGCLADFVFTMR